MRFRVAVTVSDLIDGQCVATTCTAARACSGKATLKIVKADGSTTSCPINPMTNEIDFSKINDPGYEDCKFWHGTSAADMCPKWFDGQGQQRTEPAPGKSEHTLTFMVDCNMLTSGAYNVKSCDASVRIGAVVTM